MQGIFSASMDLLCQESSAWCGTGSFFSGSEIDDIRNVAHIAVGKKFPAVRRDLRRTAAVQIIGQKGSRTLIRYDLRKFCERKAGFAVSDSVGGNNGVFEMTGLHDADPLDGSGPLVHSLPAAMLCDLRTGYILHFSVQNQYRADIKGIHDGTPEGCQVFSNILVDRFRDSGIHHMEIALAVDQERIEHQSARIMRRISDEFSLADDVSLFSDLK